MRPAASMRARSKSPSTSTRRSPISGAAASSAMTASITWSRPWIGIRRSKRAPARRSGSTPPAPGKPRNRSISACSDGHRAAALRRCWDGYGNTVHASARLPQGDDSSAAFRDVLGFRVANPVLIRSTAPRNIMETTFVEIESPEWVVAQRKDEVQGCGSHLCPDHGRNRQVKEHL